MKFKNKKGKLFKGIEHIKTIECFIIKEDDAIRETNRDGSRCPGTDLRELYKRRRCDRGV